MVHLYVNGRGGGNARMTGLVLSQDSLPPLNAPLSKYFIDANSASKCGDGT